MLMHRTVYNFQKTKLFLTAEPIKLWSWETAWKELTGRDPPEVRLTGRGGPDGLKTTGRDPSEATGKFKVPITASLRCPSYSDKSVIILTASSELH